MRRAEFKCDDFEMIKSHLNEIAFGTMIIGDSPLPYGIALNFCFLPNLSQKGATQKGAIGIHGATQKGATQKGAIGIHGAKAGRKFALLKHNPQVSFSAVKPYSYIGSEFLGGAMIPTQFFFSVIISGKFCVAEDNALKREILSALVAKYEPQSQNFSFDKKAFMGKEKGVFVGFVEIESLSVKAKFGQNLRQSDFESIMSDLEVRATEIDEQTLAMMKYFRA